MTVYHCLPLFTPKFLHFFYIEYRYTKHGKYMFLLVRLKTPVHTCK